MTQEDYDIQNQVDNLMQKVLESWKREGKWDGNNPNSPFYGFEKDPLLRILLTAFVYQTNGLKTDIQNIEKDLIGEFQNAILPYQLTQATPAFTMIKTGKNESDTEWLFIQERIEHFFISVSGLIRTAFRKTCRTAVFFSIRKINVLRARILKLSYAGRRL